MTTRIALVGPTGVLGRALVPLLLQKGHTVRVLARSTAKAQALFPQVAEVYTCDLLSDNTDDLSAMLEDCDAVAHIATAIPRDFTAPNAWEANARLRTEGVRKLLDASLKAGVRRYFQQSITMAYPDHGEDWINEDMPLDTLPERARTGSPVITMEQMVRDTSPKKLQWCILRGANFVGKDTAQEVRLEQIRAGKDVIACDGRNYLSLIHVLDMASGVATAVEHAPAGSIFNISAEPIREGDYADRLADSIGAPHPKRDTGAKCPLSWRCSNQAAKTTLKWMPSHSLIP